MPLDLQGFYPDTSPNPALGQITNTLNENKRYKEEKNYREQKYQEAEDWKKLNLIQGLTDISKHQTSSDVANEVGNRKAQEVLQKYTQAARTMSGAELQAHISKEMTGLITGLDGLKTELDLSDKMLEELKKQYPTIDAATLAKKHREDILSRRLDKDNNFVNPLTVQPSSIDLSDPEYLADFVTGNKNITNAIINPQGTEEESVLMGKQGDFTTFKGKLPFWKKPNYDRSKFNSEGFYTGGEIPSFQIKESTLSSNSLPSSSNQPFKMVESDVYKRFAEDGNLNLELIAATKKKFPTYNTFNQDEKEYAKRHVLHGMLSSLDQSQLHPVSNTRPPVTRVSVNTGKQPNQLDLREYPDVAGGGKDITSLMQGIDVVSLVTGKNFSADKVVYNPSTKRITFTDPVNNKPEEMSLTTFLQNIRPQNPAADIKWLREGLSNPIMGEKPAATNTAPTTSSKMVSVVLKDGRKGQIPADKVDAFLKDNPGSKKQ